MEEKMPGWGGGVGREWNKWKEKKEENDCEGRKKWTAVELSLVGEGEWDRENSRQTSRQHKLNAIGGGGGEIPLPTDLFGS